MQITEEKIKNYLTRFFTNKGLTFGVDPDLNAQYIANPKTDSELAIEVNEVFNYVVITLIPDGTWIEIDFGKKTLSYTIEPGNGTVTVENVNCWKKFHSAISMLLVPVNNDLFDEFIRQQFQTTCKAYFPDSDIYQSAVNPNSLKADVPTEDVEKDISIHMTCMVPGTYFEKRHTKPLFHIYAWKFKTTGPDEQPVNETLVDEYYGTVDEFSMALKRVKDMNNETVKEG